jgi:hypothetical protein
MNKNFAIGSIFIWIGFVAAISFMEAWLKFRAPGITLPLGLGIGRLVFAALNKVEITLLLVTGVVLYPFNTLRPKTKICLLIPAVIVLLQTLWMLPVLDHRAELHITGADVPHSNIHLMYAVLEVVKVASLMTAGISLFREKV